MKSAQAKANVLANKMSTYTHLGYTDFRIAILFDRSVYLEGLKNGEHHQLHRLYQTRHPFTGHGQELLKKEFHFYLYELEAQKQQGL